MATQVFQVTRVLTAAASPVARLDAINDGHELRLEIPAALAQRIAPGNVLVLNWSVHALPELAPAPVAATPAVAEAPDATLSGRAADAAFMDLMSRVRGGVPMAREPPLTVSTTPPAPQTRGEPANNNDITSLLGSTRTKGQER